MFCIIVYAYTMIRIRFANVIAVWKWWYKPIYMLVFLQYFSSNVHHLNDSIFLWNCCNQKQLSNKKVNNEVSSPLNFCMKFFTTSNSKNKIATLRIVTIEKSELTLLLILHIHGVRKKSDLHYSYIFVKTLKN